MEQVEATSLEKPSLPEPTPSMPLTGSLERNQRAFINDFPALPAEGIFTSSGPSIFGEQSILFRESDLTEDIAWAKNEYSSQPDFIRFLDGLARYLDTRYPGDPDKWKREFVGKNIDSQTTLDTIRNEGAASCFHRSLVNAYVLQHLGIEAKFVAGEWVETTRNRVVGSYPKGQEVPYDKKFATMGFRYLIGEKGDAHAFTLIRKEGKYYLADAALWVKDGSGNKMHPVIKEVAEQELMERDIVVPLPTGEKRHYVFKRDSLQVKAT